MSHRSWYDSQLTMLGSWRNLVHTRVGERKRTEGGRDELAHSIIRVYGKAGHGQWTWTRTSTRTNIPRESQDRLWPACLASVHQSVSPQCHSGTLLSCKLPLLRRKSPHERVLHLLNLLYSFSSTWSSAVNFCTRSWVVRPRRRLQHVQEGQWQKQSFWFIHSCRLHFLCQEVQHDPIQPSARSI